MEYNIEDDSLMDMLEAGYPINITKECLESSEKMRYFVEQLQKMELIEEISPDKSMKGNAKVRSFKTHKNVKNSIKNELKQKLKNNFKKI